MFLLDLIGYLGYAMEAFGVFVIIAGAAIAVANYGYKQIIAKGGVPYNEFRRVMGRSMMVGLEFLVAGDIIRTVVASHTLEDISILGLVVIIRTVLVFTIHLELEGHWPWQPAPDHSTSNENPPSP
jgi:uncharacterized membrane protein